MPLTYSPPTPVWRLTAQYVSGYKVVWHGVVYEARWTNQGRDPSEAGDATTLADNTVMAQIAGSLKD